jgi:nonribosomal peptide synthetase protein BlmVIII
VTTGGGPEPIAIVSAVGRFPGAASVESFWANLRAEVESIARFQRTDLLLSDRDPEHVLHPRFVGAEGVIDDPALFDAAFFRYPPREAALMDPQHRICLELAWEAFDSVGYDPATLAAPTGVFLSTGLSCYLIRNLLSGDPQRQREMQRRDGLHLLMHNDKDFAPTTVSHRLGLTGPSYAVGSACSSSLVAVHLAVRSLVSHECDLALAGGAFVQVPHGHGYVSSDDGIYSPRGRCAAFDADADGTVGASGAGLVLLKRLSDARRDGDHIHAVILGSAVNNDGADKVGYTAPGVRGQAEVIMEAHAVSGVPADSIGYVEAHGTGTTLGDPVEVEALTLAFRPGTRRRQFCALGSVKTNIGHLDAAAGIAGLIKTALVVRDGVIPASLHFRRPNPEIDFARTPFVVAARTAPWPVGAGPRRAGVSSFGIGGTNVHVVVEEPPAPPDRSRTPRREHALLLSARTAAALAVETAALAGHLRAHPDLDLPDVAATLARRRPLAHRRAVLGCNLGEMLRQLDSVDARAARAESAVPGREVVLVLPGQGPAPAELPAQVAAAEPAFGDHLAECDRLLAELGYDLTAALRPMRGLSQPALFALEYSYAATLAGWGIRPVAMVGHSLGEYTAATLAGVLALRDALRLLVVRDALYRRLPPGRLVAVPLPEAELADLLPEGVELAAVNAPDRCVAGGAPEAVARLRERLRELGVASAPLAVGSAFHTAAVTPVLAGFRVALETVALHEPTCRYVSSLTGTWADPEEVRRPAYWLDQMRHPVRFADGVARCLAIGPVVALEAGPAHGLDTLVRRNARFTDQHRTVPGLSVRPVSLTPVLAALWTAGAAVDWAAVHGPEQPRRVPLPSQRLHRERYWIDPPAQPAGLPPLAELTGPLRADLAADGRRPRGVDDHPGLRAGLDRLCADLALRYLAQGGVDIRSGRPVAVAEIEGRLGVLPQFHRFLGVLLDLLIEDGLALRSGAQVRFAVPPDRTADRAAIGSAADRLAAAHPDFGGLVELLVHCADGYPAALSQPGAALARLYPDGRSDLLTRLLTDRTGGHRGVDRLVELAGRLLDLLAGSLDRPVRVLEVGAGEGTLSQVLAGRAAGRLVYHVTDVSRSFVAELAAQARSRGLDAVRTGVFDITRDPADQGLAGHRYDLVCGLDVVHATPDIRRSVANLRRLLAPGGVLALVETTATDRWLPLIWGLADGWWSYTDGRTGGPLLSAPAWRDLVAALDFATTDVIVPDPGRADAALVLAQEPGPATTGGGAAGGGVGGAAGGRAALMAAWPAKRADRTGWGYQPGWRHEPRPPAAHAPVRGACLILSDGAAGAAVARRLADRGATVVTVGRRAGWGPAGRRLDPAVPEQYRDLVRGLATAGTPVRLVVHLWALEEAAGRGSAAGSAEIGAAQLCGMHSLLYLAKALGDGDQREEVRIVAATRGAQDVLGYDVAHPEHTTLAAAAKVIPREFPWISCAAVDVAPDGSTLDELADRLVAELLGARETQIVAYRGRHRFAPQVAPYPLAPVTPDAPGVAPRPGGVYLVCGGFGGIGLSIAEWLGRTPARIVLTGRRTLPPESAWASYAEADPGDPTGRVVRRLLDLRAAGAEVLARTADITDLSRMREVVAEAEDRFGPLTGVVHAAGVLDLAGMIQRRSRESTDAAIAAKTRGTLVLHEAVGDRPLDFFVLCSSIGTVLYKLKFGEVGYVAGNEFLNAFAEYRAARAPGITVAVAWSDWLEEGMWADAQRRLGARYTVGPGADLPHPADDVLGGITRAEGIDVLARILAHGPAPRVVVSTQDLHELLARHEAFTTADHLAAVSRLAVNPAGGGVAGGGVAGGGAANGLSSPVQRAVAGFWSTLLGVSEVAATDNFFTLGGDSLLALRLLAMVRDEYGVELSIARIFDNPTVAELAEAVECEHPATVAGTRREVVV